MTTKQGILNDEYFYKNCFEYRLPIGIKQVDYITNASNSFYDGIKPPKYVRPVVNSGAPDITAINNAKLFKGNKQEIARHIIEKYQERAKKYKPSKVEGVKELYSKKLYNKSNNFNDMFNYEAGFKMEHNQNNQNIPIIGQPRFTTGMSLGESFSESTLSRQVSRSSSNLDLDYDVLHYEYQDIYKRTIESYPSLQPYLILHNINAVAEPKTEREQKELYSKYNQLIDYITNHNLIVPPINFFPLTVKQQIKQLDEEASSSTTPLRETKSPDTPVSSTRTPIPKQN